MDIVDARKRIEIKTPEKKEYTYEEKVERGRIRKRKSRKIQENLKKQGIRNQYINPDDYDNEGVLIKR